MEMGVHNQSNNVVLIKSVLAVPACIAEDGIRVHVAGIL
jgi:hypothetical protein